MLAAAGVFFIVSQVWGASQEKDAGKMGCFYLVAAIICFIIGAIGEVK